MRMHTESAVAIGCNLNALCIHDLAPLVSPVLGYQYSPVLRPTQGDRAVQINHKPMCTYYTIMLHSHTMYLSG